ncbi:hypothetical protein M758_6G139300 [Ceratodon purpureus]|nr:hypothetical protein M758_6G139300 [Ceratodon purpureus]
MMWMDWLEWIGSGVEMAWARLRQDHALHWSVTALLDASVEVVVAFMVLVCTVLNFFTSSFIRVSGFHIPCSCCVHFRKDSSVIEVTASQNFSLSASKSIGAASREAISYDLTFEGLTGKDGADSEFARFLRYEYVNKDLNDRTQEDVDRVQFAKVHELLRALQAERETMASLYSELEQERNSSATAASEALAMISRLQEEKAAIQMESWQFQRMVMEKAMYDQEAIEVLKEILAKQEEERLDLEEEVRLYKERLDEILMEEQDYAERIGRDYVPMHLLEGTLTDGNSISPKSERGELLSSERITPSGSISKEDRLTLDVRLVKEERKTPDGIPSKEERITPNGRPLKEERITPTGRPSKEERITPNGRPSKEERITPNGRPSKEERITPNGRIEDAEFLDRLSKTKSQLLTALLQEGFPEPPSVFVEDSASFAKEMHKAIAKIPARAESLPILDHDHYKVGLGLGPIKVGREIGLPLPPAVAKKQTESVSVSREPTPPLTIAKTDKVWRGKDAGRVADEPTPPPNAEENTEKVRAVKNDGKPDESVFISREIGLPIPSVAAKKQNEKTYLVKDAGKFTDKPLIISREVSLPILPPVATKKQIEKAFLKDDGKVGGEPEFLSLKRRWSSRGTQEISVETLAKAKEDRRMEEKRLSVLEYVRNLEEQLQQQAGRPAPQLARARSVDGREEDVRFRSSGHYESSSVSAMSENSGVLERDESVQRRLFADGDSARQELSMNSLQGGDDDKLYAQQYSINSESGGKVSYGEGGFYVNTGTSAENVDEALFVHDVYEVPHESGN